MEILETAIQAEGGVSHLAAALDVQQNVVSNWRARGLPKPWAQLLRLKYAAELGRPQQAPPPAPIQADAALSQVNAAGQGV